MAAIIAELGKRRESAACVSQVVNAQESFGRGGIEVLHITCLKRIDRRFLRERFAHRIR
jgi:hypothetical protein